MLFFKMLLCTNWRDARPGRWLLDWPQLSGRFYPECFVWGCIFVLVLRNYHLDGVLEELDGINVYGPSDLACAAFILELGT